MFSPIPTSILDLKLLLFKILSSLTSLKKMLVQYNMVLNRYIKWNNAWNTAKYLLEKCD